MTTPPAVSAIKDTIGSGYMITAIELTNVKGIADKQRIELAPITLLFRPNSAGTRVIVQAPWMGEMLRW